MGNSGVVTGLGNPYLKGESIKSEVSQNIETGESITEYENMAFDESKVVRNDSIGSLRVLSDSKVSIKTSIENLNQIFKNLILQKKSFSEIICQSQRITQFDSQVFEEDSNISK